jgi:hypothetical protein
MTSQNSSVIMQPCVSYWGMHKSARNLDAITSYYFPIYGLSEREFFTYYPVLTFVESVIYQADEKIEESQINKSFLYGINYWVKTKNLIINFLKERNLEHPLIEKYLDDLEEYYHLENRLMSEETVTYTDIIKAAELRTSDLRTLHAILFRMTNKPYNRNAFNVMWTLEVLADLEDDIKQYESDVKKDNYNTYRMLVKLYGEKALNYLQAELERYNNLLQERIAQSPENEQKMYLEILSRYKKELSAKAIPEPILE